MERNIDKVAKAERLAAANILRKLAGNEMGADWVVELFQDLDVDRKATEDPAKRASKANKLLTMLGNYIKLSQTDDADKPKGGAAQERTPDEIMRAFKRVTK